MRIKTFYTKTMSEAFREIKNQLGNDAVLLSSKEVPRRSGVWGASSGFEVVAAVDGDDDGDVFSYSADHAALDKAERHAPPVASAAAEASLPVSETYSPAVVKRNALKAKPASRKTAPKKAAVTKPTPAETKTRRKSAAKSSRAKIEAAPASSPSPSSPCESDIPCKGRVPLALYEELLRQGVDAGLARELIVRAVDYLTVGQRRSRPALIRAIAHSVLPLVSRASTRNGLPGKKVVAFVGPTGVGKTTSIAKLAARLALQQKKKVILMTLDGYRIGAVEQLRSYAGLMGIPFRFVSEESELPQAIEENSERDYILIDTAGRSPKDLDMMDNLAAYLKNADFIEKHLVLSATTNPGDMRRIMDRFEVCAPDHLLFTKLDETSAAGPILNELVRTKKSFSYYSDGQRVPDDLHTVPGERLIEIVLNNNETEGMNL